MISFNDAPNNGALIYLNKSLFPPMPVWEIQERSDLQKSWKIPDFIDYLKNMLLFE